MLGLDNPTHILFLLVLLLLVFGAKRLPEVGRSLGTGLRGFKETLSGEVSHRVPLRPDEPDGLHHDGSQAAAGGEQRS